MAANFKKISEIVGFIDRNEIFFLQNIEMPNSYLPTFATHLLQLPDFRGNFCEISFDGGIMLIQPWCNFFANSHI